MADNRLQTVGSPAVAKHTPNKEEARANELALLALGRAVRELREQRQMSADQLAAATRTTPRRIKRVEAGLVDVRYDLLVKLVKTLDVKRGELIGRMEALELELKRADADRRSGSDDKRKEPETK
jgi:transcriptional regulator with XRE-family HTH domain